MISLDGGSNVVHDSPPAVTKDSKAELSLLCSALYAGSKRRYSLNAMNEISPY